MITIYRSMGKITKIEVNQAGKDAIYDDYNALMAKYEKVEKYMEDGNIPVEKKLLYVPQFIDLLREISASKLLLKLIGD